LERTATWWSRSATGRRAGRERRARAAPQPAQRLVHRDVLPQLSFAVTSDEPLAWRFSHGAFGVTHAVVWGTFFRRSRRHGAGRTERRVFWGMAPWAALLWFLLVAAVQFVVLLDHR
jgi:hypothetical protein